MKVVMQKSFLKDVSKLGSQALDERIKNEVFKIAFEHNAYLKKWRKLLSVSYNKHDTLEFAKAVKLAKPDLSLYQARLIVSQCSYYGYGWFGNIFVRLFDEKLANEIEELLKYISLMGKTHYEKVHTPEYEKALDKWFEGSFEKILDSSGEETEVFTLNEKNQDPILNITEEEQQIMKTEMKEEEKELGEKIANWVKENQNIQQALPTIFRIWSKTYSHWSWNAGWREVCGQLDAVRQDILEQNWSDLAKQFQNLPGWWD